MDAERTLLSCPGRVQDWLDAAADQIETLLQVPQPSLSGSDQAIGALRLKREGPSWTAGPYSLQSTDLVSGAFPIADQVPPSVSQDWPLCEEKSPSRCENCVSEKRSRCSRDFPSCTRCHANGFSCFSTEGVPTGRRNPQMKARGHVEEELGLPAEPFLTIPASGHPAPLETDEAVATRCHRPDIHILQTVSHYARPPLKKHTAFSSPADTRSVGGLVNPPDQAAVTKRQTTMLPATPTFSTLPRRASKLHQQIKESPACHYTRL